MFKELRDRILWLIVAVSMQVMVLPLADAFAAEQKFRIGVELLAYFPAYDFRAEGPGDSASYAILEDFARKNGITFEYVPLPVNRLYKDFLDQKVDFKFPDNPKWKGDLKAGKTIVYSDPVFDYIDGTMVLPKHKGQGKKAIKKVASVLGFTIWDYLDDVNKGLVKTSEYPNFTELLRAGLKDLVDGVYVNVAVGNYHLEEKLNQAKGLVFDPSLPFTQDSYRLSTIKHPEILQKFTSYLKANAKALDGIKKKYKVDVSDSKP